ncbi:SDR family oxidoreductase [Streptomyces sp. NPDC001480]|uniref:SDR family oxidoreductase n=1 Tax=Streptomyces sp. NPDC001480 TaxID=3364577 RepID=UPI00368046E1
MIVVTGATGNVGRTLVRLLVEAGERVTGVARRITEADVPPGARAVAADLGEPEGLRPALEGAEALFLLVAGEDPQGIVGAAKAAGVRRLVLLSSQGAGTRPQVYGHAAGFEAAVRESGLEWTVLRSGGLASNAFAWAEPVRLHRTAAAPFGDVGLPFVDPDDVAAVGAAVLRAEGPGRAAGSGHAGATYTLTGPAPTTPRERAAALAAALGEPVRFVEQTREEAEAQMAAFMPLPVVTGTLALLGAPMPEEQQVSPDVERVLGRAPGTFAQWATRNVEAFR